MKTRDRIHLSTLASLAILALANPAHGGSISNGPTAPAIGADDIANYGALSGTDKWWSENSTAGATKGQTFTTGNAAVLLKAITYRTTTATVPTKTFAIRVGTVAGSTLTFTEIASETATQSAAWAADDYVTWTLDEPVLLASNTTYGVDVGMKSSTTGWQSGIPYLAYTANVYAGGTRFMSGTSGVGTTAMFNLSKDMVFHLNLEKPISSDFLLVATSPANGSAEVLASNPLSATFSRNLVQGSGGITLRNLTDSVDTAIPITDTRISITENLLTIDPGSALGWSKEYAVRIDPGALVSDTGIDFAGISDDATWTFTTAASDPLLTALGELKDHITSTSTLTAAQIEAHKLTIDAEKSRFGNSSTVIAAAFDLVTTYDTVLGALWVARGLPGRSSVTNDLHWTIYTVMQDIMDVTYNANSLATYETLLNGFKFASSANFPGACTPPADPNQSHTATINASYADTWGRATQGDGPGTFARKPTGCYLAPGSIATVTVPQALVGKGYMIRVGCHSWDFSNKPSIKRLDRSTLVYGINALQTKVANPLGGGIYLEVPFLADGGVVDVQITNAVRSPYFSAKSFHQTTPAQWLTERTNPAPWADFQSDKFMMQVPRGWIYALPDPVTLMADWDAAMDAINDLMGFPQLRGKETMYLQVDLLTRASVYAPGYPAVNNSYNPATNYGGYANSYHVRGPRTGWEVEFHEQGHAYFFPKFGSETESNVNLLWVPVQNRKFGVSLDDAFRQSVNYGNFKNVTHAPLDNAAVLWMTSFNFSPRKVAMAAWEKAYQPQGHAKFVDIARLFGWDGLNAFWSEYNSKDEIGQSYPRDTDSMLLQLCKSVGKDIRPLLHFWGILPQNPAALAAAVAAEELTAPAEIYDLLLRYQSLVPADNAAYQAWCRMWYGKPPSINGYGVEREHTRQWDETDYFTANGWTQERPNGEIYVEASATDIRSRVQELVDLYYPDGRPITDTSPPTLAGSAIADDQGGGPVTVNTLVTHTVTFSEDMDAGTVSAADFGNAGTAAVTIGTVTATSPGVFTVPATPTSAGTLQLQVNQNAELKDVAGLALDTASAIPDDTTITVQTAYAAWAGGADFTTDANHDGVPNGLAWLLGATDPAASASGLLPKATYEADKLVLTFRCLTTAKRGAAVLKVQFSNDLGQADPWASHEAVVPAADGTVGSVYFDTTADADPAFINVRAEIPSGAAPPDGRLFARLYSAEN